MVVGSTQVRAIFSPKGLGVLPMVAVLSIALPLIWTYGPDFWKPSIDIQPGLHETWFTAISTDGPYAVDPKDPGCKPTKLISKAKPGDRIAWWSDFTLDPRASNDTEYFMERVSDHARFHSLTGHTAVGANRHGLEVRCYLIPSDASPGLYEIRRQLVIYPPNGASFRRDNISIPVEVTAP